MKSKRLFWASLALLLFTSCASKPVPLPGDAQKTRENMYNEYMVIADSFFELEKYDKAITYYKMCLEKPNLYWASYYKLAKAYALQSNWNEAATMYKVILERDPENDSLKASLAYIYAMQGETKIALEMYNELMKLHPENQEYLENYIAVQLLSKDFTDIDAPMAALNKDFPDSKNIQTFNSKISQIIDDQIAAEKKAEEEKAAAEKEKAEKKSN